MFLWHTKHLYFHWLLTQPSVIMVKYYSAAAVVVVVRQRETPCALVLFLCIICKCKLLTICSHLVSFSSLLFSGIKQMQIDKSSMYCLLNTTHCIFSSSFYCKRTLDLAEWFQQPSLSNLNPIRNCYYLAPLL